MASQHIRYLVILSLISCSLQDVTDNKVDSKDESPLAEAAAEILKEQNLANIGGMINNFIQSGGAKEIIDGVVQNVASGNNAGQLLESLGNLMKTAGGGEEKYKQKKKDDSVNPIDLLQGLGSLMGALQGAGGTGGENNPAALLQGLGSLLGANQGGQGANPAALLQSLGSLVGGNNKKRAGGAEDDSNPAALLQGLGSLLGSSQDEGGANPATLLQGLGSLLGGGGDAEGGINPEIIGQFVNMFASSEASEKKKKKSKGKGKESGSAKKKSKKDEKPRAKDDFLDLGDMISMATSFLNQGNGKSKVNFMDFLPMIMQTINAFVGPEAQERSDSHSGHSWFLPPLLEKFHLFMDNFLHSDMAKYVLSWIGSEKSFQVFADENGNFSYQKFEELVENHSFRRHWIQMLTTRLVDILQVVSDPKRHNEYLNSGLVFVNSFFKSQGFPKDALFDPKKPAKTLTAFVNHAAKKYVDAQVDSREYVEPVVTYVQDVLQMAQKSISLGKEPKELTDKLTDTMNMEIIEPITRVNRAYRFAKSQPKCDRYVFCLINQNTPSTLESLPGLKIVLYKGSSLVAGWFLSSHTGTPFWDLYADITEDKNCHDFYYDKCDGFHAEEIKVTTEYVHNEL